MASQEAEAYYAAEDESLETGAQMGSRMYTDLSYPGGGETATPTYAERSATRFDQSNAERVLEQQGNYMYGGYAGGADQASQRAREVAGSYGDTLGMYGNQFFDQAAHGGDIMNMGVANQYLTAGALTDFAQQGPGPSLAQAQLDASTAQGMRQQLALAGSGRGAGGGAAAFRTAAANQAQMQGAANAQAAVLRAQEEDARRQRQLQAYGMAGQLYGAGADLGSGYATGMGDLATGAQQAGGNLALGGEQLAHQIQGTALTGSMGYENNLSDIYAIDKNYQRQQAQDDMTTKDWIGLGMSAAGTVGMIASDVRAKTNIEPASALDAIDDAGSYSYNYLNPERHGEGTYVGPMAQELESAPGVVYEQANGTKAIDPGRLTTLNTSAIAELNQKVDALAEQTPLSGEEEDAFYDWARRNNIRDVDDPRAKYDYRGFFEETGGAPVRWGVDHFPDTYKQHGHPTFSVESKYSRGPNDGGRWEGERFIPQSNPDSPSGFNPYDDMPVRAEPKRAPRVNTSVAPSQPGVADALHSFSGTPSEGEIAKKREAVRALYGSKAAGEFEAYAMARRSNGGSSQNFYTDADAADFEARIAGAVGEGPKPYTEGDAADFQRRIGEAYTAEDADRAEFERRISEAVGDTEPVPVTAARPATGPTQPIAFTGDPATLDYLHNRYGTPVLGAGGPTPAEQESSSYLETLFGADLGDYISDVATGTKADEELKQIWRNPPRVDTFL